VKSLARMNEEAHHKQRDKEDTQAATPDEVPSEETQGDARKRTTRERKRAPRSDTNGQHKGS